MVNRRNKRSRFLILAGLVWFIGGVNVASAYESLFQEHAETFGVPAEILMAIAKTESNLSAYALNVGGRSYMARTQAEACSVLRSHRGSCTYIGLMQIDRRWFPRMGLKPEDGLDPNKNITVGAKILSQCVKRYGLTWKAVAAYNSSPSSAQGRKYCEKVAKNLRKIVQKKHVGKTIPNLDTCEGKELISLVMRGMPSSSSSGKLAMR